MLTNFVPHPWLGSKIPSSVLFPNMQPGMAQESFGPGETVQTSGVYTVIHREHRAEHEVTMLAGTVFPTCAVCGSDVRFRLVSGVSPSAASDAAPAD